MTSFLKAFVALFIALTFAGSFAAQAQNGGDDEIVWVQIEAHPSLAQATRRARFYTGQIQDVNGFSLGAGWYGLAVGPYRRADAEVVLRQYVRQGLVPRDSYIQFSSRLRQQFWPVGANVLNNGVVVDPNAPDAGTQTPAAPEVAQTPAETTTQTPAEPQVADVATPEPEPEPVIKPSDETLRQAQASERQLTRDEKKDLQIALKWAGFYTSTIDGSYGRGTRRSMAAWQEANNFENTGVLTTLQRRVLLGQYNAVLDGLGLRMVRDTKAGIEMMMPTAEVRFDKYEAPFAQYNSTGDIGARVLLISQAGDQDTLFGLYDIMQTLQIVPREGERKRGRSSFDLIGQNSRIISTTQARLENGEIKGFTLIWPTGDEDRRTRVLAAMQKSFARLPGTLDPAEGSDEDQAIDLVSGLQIRQPKVSRSGFFIDNKGAVLTTSEAVQSCGRLTIDGDTNASVVLDDTASGIAVIKPATAVAPQAIASFSVSPPRLQSEIAVAGYPYEGVLSAATLTFGKMADVKGLRGEVQINRLALNAQPGDAGGPVFDASGNVMGMMMPEPRGGQQLPDDVSFALESAAIAEVVSGAGLSLKAADSTGTVTPRDLTLAAQGMTVLVSCWE